MGRGISAILSSIFAKRQKREENALLEVELSTNRSGAGIYAPNARTLLFESVLSRKLTADSGRSPTSAKRQGKTEPPRSRKIQDDDDLRIAKDVIVKSAKTLASLSDKSIAEHIDRLLEMTEAQHCNIAFIGQMNAGKSTLINALIGTPDLLPSEITPWTTVVTNLYFGIPGKPTTGAVFEFFQEAEWQQLSEGSGRVRALTERFIPNFSWDSFHRQVSNMRESAERRLGAHYSDLLGKQHAFTALSEGLLEKYVAAESPLGEDASASGEFSTITKAAHLYFDLMNFFYPTVLIDTPGINDPFLVRDEITRQNLERANIFVIVVTARQPLSTVDIDLLRILHGLRKENFIIFVNKIDEIDDFDSHAGAIADRIKALLKREFPDADIPIIVGCAEWAAVALGQDVRKQQELARVHNFSVSLIGDGTRTFWLSDPTAEAAAIADDILTRSAIPALAAAISNILHAGPIVGSLRHAASALLALAKNGLARTEAQAEQMRATNARHPNDNGAPIGAEAELGRGLEAAVAAAASINETITQVQARYSDVIDHAKQDLIVHLQSKLKGILSAQERADNPRASLSISARSALVSELRTSLEAEFSRLFQDVNSYMSEVTKSVELTLSEKIDIAASALGLPIEYPHLPAFKCAPSLAALSDPIATEFGGLAHAASWNRATASENKRQLLNLLEAEFTIIIGKLAEAARDELERTTRFILDHFRFHASRPVELIIEFRRKPILEGSQAAEQARNGGHGQRGEALTTERKRLEDDAKTYAGVIAALQSIKLGEPE
jgi:GTP-binding protein EngB required for normal cell division